MKGILNYDMAIKVIKVKAAEIKKYKQAINVYNELISNGEEEIGGLHASIHNSKLMYKKLVERNDALVKSNKCLEEDFDLMKKELRESNARIFCLKDNLKKKKK